MLFNWSRDEHIIPYKDNLMFTVKISINYTILTIGHFRVAVKHYESEAKCKVFIMKIIFHSYANKTNFIREKIVP